MTATPRPPAPGRITYRLAPDTPLSVSTATAYEFGEKPHILGAGSELGRGGASEFGRGAASEPGERSGRLGERSGRFGETTGAEPLERLAAAFYEDLHLIARSTTLPLWQALAAPDIYADQPDLLARLVSADVEQLWRSQLIAGVALVLGDLDDSNAPNEPLIRYCAAYILRRLVSPLPDEPDPPSFTRLAERFDRARDLGPATALALLIASYPAVSPTERAATITFPRYQFPWTPLAPVTLDDSALRALPHAPLLTAGGTGGEWTRTQLDDQRGRQPSPFW